MENKKRNSEGPAQDHRKHGGSQKSPEAGSNKDKLPGEYPPGEDIMNRLNSERVGIDVENFSRKIGVSNKNMHEPVVTRSNDIQDDPVLSQDDIENDRKRRSMEQPVPRDFRDLDDDGNTSESDVTEEDMQALGPRDLSMDMGEDEALKNRVWPVDMAGEDLDVPGSELDDASESIGSEDEENNSYSLGGDSHEDNLEGK